MPQVCIVIVTKQIGGFEGFCFRNLLRNKNILGIVIETHKA